MSPEERRVLVKQLIAGGARPSDVARTLGVSPATVAKDFRYAPKIIECAACGTAMQKIRKAVTCSPDCSVARKRACEGVRREIARRLPGPARDGITVEQFLEARRPAWARSAA